MENGGVNGVQFIQVAASVSCHKCVLFLYCMYIRGHAGLLVRILQLESVLSTPSSSSTTTNSHDLSFSTS